MGRISIVGISISGMSGMKSERFTAGQLWIERNRRREGPPVVYTVLCGNSARPFTDPKAILKWVKWPKGTPTGDALREWLASFDKKPEAPAPELDMAKIKSEGFGPEAHDEKTIDPITGEEIPDDPIFDDDRKTAQSANAVLRPVY